MEFFGIRLVGMNSDNGKKRRSFCTQHTQVALLAKHLAWLI